MVNLAQMLILFVLFVFNYFNVNVTLLLLAGAQRPLAAAPGTAAGAVQRSDQRHPDGWVGGSKLPTSNNNK